MTFVNLTSNIERNNLLILEFIYNFKYSTKIVGKHHKSRVY